MENILKNYPEDEQASQEPTLCEKFDELEHASNVSDYFPQEHTHCACVNCSPEPFIDWSLFEDQDKPRESGEGLSKEDLQEIANDLKNKSIYQCVVRRPEATFYGFGQTMAHAIMDGHNHYHASHRDYHYGPGLSSMTFPLCFICQLEENDTINLESDNNSDYRLFNFHDFSK